MKKGENKLVKIIIISIILIILVVLILSYSLKGVNYSPAIKKTSIQQVNLNNAEFVNFFKNNPDSNMEFISSGLPAVELLKEKLKEQGDTKTIERLNQGVIHGENFEDMVAIKEYGVLHIHGNRCKYVPSLLTIIVGRRANFCAEEQKECIKDLGQNAKCDVGRWGIIDNCRCSN